MINFDDLNDQSDELEQLVDEAEFEELDDEELDELIVDAMTGFDDEDDDYEDRVNDDYDDSMDGDHATGLRDAGFGTDEDYGYYGENEDWD